MTELPTEFVIRRRAPLRGLTITVAAVVLGLLALYAVYELGRYDAGYDRLAVFAQRSELKARIDTLESTNRRLHQQLAELDTLRIGRAQERAELARTIGDLQTQIARQTQELAFYRDYVAQQGNTQGEPEGGVKIQQVRITALAQPQHFHVHLALVQAAHPEASVSGTLTLALVGQSGGHPANLDDAALTGTADASHSFTFHYFQDFDQDVTVPAGFLPDHLAVEVHSARKGVAPLQQNFGWRVDPS